MGPFLVVTTSALGVIVVTTEEFVAVRSLFVVLPSLLVGNGSGVSERLLAVLA